MFPRKKRKALAFRAVLAVKTMLKQMMDWPTRMMYCSRQVWARIMVPTGWLEWWRKLLERGWPG